ncbi:MAG: methyltransferase domain-containing protein [Nocardioides sp.]
MAGCCDPRGCDDIFGSRFARRTARAYRRRGLDPAAAWMVDFLAEDGIDGASVLEIGGGVGDIGIELARRGAASVTTLELTAAYDQDAARLAGEAGVADRMQRRIVDVAAAPPGDVEEADVVVLHRVVCCYPDYPRLLGAAAALTRRRLAFSHPPRNAVSRAVIAAQNVALAVGSKEFRTFAHPPHAMVGVVEQDGLGLVARHRGRIWQAEGLAR